MRTLRNLAVVSSVVALLSTAARAQHTGDMLIGSSTTGGGTLAVDYDFDVKILATPNVIPGFFSTTEPGFDAILAAEPGHFPLANGTTVQLEIVAIAAGAQLQIHGTTLDGADDTAVIGTVPDLHTHPQWQLLLEEGVAGDFPVAFRLTAAGGAYAQSVVYEAVVTNVDGGVSPTATPTLATTTPTPAPTLTPADGRLCGDADGSGQVTVSDGVNVLRAAAGLSSTCTDPAPCDVNGNGAITVTDGVGVLRTAAGLPADLQCFALE